MKELIKRLNKAIESKVNLPDKFPEFSNPNYQPHQFSKDNFTKIKPMQSDKRVAFIDGGNAEILGSSNFSLQLVRAFASIVSNNKRVDSQKTEFYALTYTECKDKLITFKTELFPIKGILPDKDDLVFDSMDKTLRTGEFRTAVQKIGDVTRAFSELSLANETDAEMIVLDGTLEANTTNIGKYFEKLYKNKAKICAVSKTVRMFTDSGNNVVSALLKIAPSGRWIYHPVCDINSVTHQADIYFAKLHEKSDYIFKLEHYKEQKPDSDLFSILAANSNDAVFLGYPYGLFDADRFARVSNREVEMRRTDILARSGKIAELIKTASTSIDAHSILDKAAYKS